MEIPKNFEEAYHELTQIAKEIEDQTVSVDVLADKVQRASELIAFCQNKLKKTETTVNEIVGKIDQSDSVR